MFLISSSSAQNTISNIKLSVNAGTFATGTPISATYDYAQTKRAVKVTISPSYLGSGMTYSSSATATYTLLSGSGSGYIFLASPGTIDQIHFKMFDATSNTLLFESIVNVNIKYVDFAIANLKFVPSSPRTLAVGQNLNFSYDYIQTEDTVKLIIIPSYIGTGGYYSSGNKTFLTPTGNSSGFVSLVNEGTIDSLIFRFYSTKNVLLYEQSEPADYKFAKFQVHNLNLPNLHQAFLLSGKI